MTPQEFNEDTAYHEAGHAFAAWRLGIPVKYITIKNATWPITRIPTNGHVSLLVASGLENKAQKLIMVDLAGGIAEHIHNPLADIEFSTSEDIISARNLARLVCRTRKSVHPFMRWVKRETRALIQTDWHCIEALVLALRSEDTISGSACSLIMEAADAIRQANSVDFQRSLAMKSQVHSST